MKRDFFTLVILMSAVFVLNESAKATPYYLEHSFSIPGISRLDGLAFDDSTGHLFGVTAAGIPDTLYEFTTSGSLVASYRLDFLPGVGSARTLTYNMNTGNLFLCEAVNERIYEITTNGIEVRFFSGPGLATEGMAYNSSTDTLFVSCLGAPTWNPPVPSVIYEIDPDNGSVVNSFAPPGDWVRGLEFDGTNLLAYEAMHGCIYELNPSNGEVVQWFGVNIPFGDTGLTFGGGRIYVWNDTIGRVHVYVPEPSTVILLGLGAGMLGRKRKKAC